MQLGHVGWKGRGREAVQRALIDRANTGCENHVVGSLPVTIQVSCKGGWENKGWKWGESSKVIRGRNQDCQVVDIFFRWRGVEGHKQFALRWEIYDKSRRVKQCRIPYTLAQWMWMRPHENGPVKATKEWGFRASCLQATKKGMFGPKLRDTVVMTAIKSWKIEYGLEMVYKNTATSNNTRTSLNQCNKSILVRWFDSLSPTVLYNMLYWVPMYLVLCPTAATQVAGWLTGKNIAEPWRARKS